MKILTVIGARPQFIKAGPVSREIKRLRREGINIEEIIVHTGQHYDKNMSDVFFEELQLPKPNYFLGVGGKSHGAMTGEMIIKLEEVMLKERPDVVLVYGDTNSTLAGAIAASKLHIPIAHVEAGLRSFNMKMPEEINRVLTDRLSRWLFCPTDNAVKNLLDEGFANFNCRITKVGDVMYDANLFYRRFLKPPSELNIRNNFVLSTIHRAENTDDVETLSEIIQALREITKDVQVVLPLHPRTYKVVKQQGISLEGLTVIKPVSYLEMMWLLENCCLVITDSGGLQKEAFFFEKPCLVLRENTEWKELVENGFAVLVGTKKERILHFFRNFKFNLNYGIPLYGKGNASRKVIKVILEGI